MNVSSPFLLHILHGFLRLHESSYEFIRFDPQLLENSKNICRKMYLFLSPCVALAHSNVDFLSLK